MIRQNLYLSYFFPVALGLLKGNLFIGSNFDGELVKVLSKVPLDFWANYQDLKQDMNSLILLNKVDVENRQWSSIEEKEYFFRKLESVN